VKEPVGSFFDGFNASMTFLTRFFVSNIKESPFIAIIPEKAQKNRRVFSETRHKIRGF
jgi:hypothetical protein